jgi:hypothetical protein
MRNGAAPVVVTCIALAAAFAPACKTKPKITLRDPATLPHVTRPFPKLESTIAFTTGTPSGLLHCYGEALGRDPKAGGTFHVVAIGTESRTAITVDWKNAAFDKASRYCIEAGLNDWQGISVAKGSRAEGDVTLTSALRSEATPPGWVAYGKAIEARVRNAPVRVLAVRVPQPLAEDVADDKRTLSGNVDTDLELTKGGTYELRGSISDFAGAESGWRGPPCPKVHHIKGDKITTSGWLNFTLDQPDGWSDGGGRHWFGDEPRELEE